MMSLKKLMIAAVAATGMACAAQASASVVTAQGAGWCNSGGYCDSNGTYISNTAAGYGDSYRNFFNFDLSTLNGPVTGATLSIWNDMNNSAGSNSTDYVLHAASGISYAGLASGATIGSIKMAVADNHVNHYVDIVLNQAGLNALTGAAGHSFLFGGSTVDNGLAFGWTNGLPAAKLTLETGAVPEPASIALLGLGMGAALLARRRRKA